MVMLTTYDSYLDDEYHFIGSTNNEEFLNRKATTKFFKDTAEQLAGKCDLRNEKRTMEQFGELIFITHFFDAWFLNDKEYNYYGRFRFTSALQKNKEVWRFIYQHFSTPDSKTEEGETIGFDKINEENQELREAIQRRTLELEHKNRELEIETALERVRARTMGMHKSEELKEVIQVVYDQFVYLNINIEHTGFIIDYKNNEDMHIWLADQNAVFPQITLPYFDCAHWNSFREAKKKGKNFFANQLDFEEKNKFYKDLFQFIPDLSEEVKEHYFTCPALAISTVLLDNVGLYMENFEGIPYTGEENKILMRFGKVFQQTYTRFLDLQKAEAQAREAQIEASLERVRSMSMAMHKTSELQHVIHTVHIELLNLDISINGGSFIAINDDIDNEIKCWGAGGTANTSEEVIIPRFEKPFYTNLLKGLKKGPGFFTEEFTQKEKKEFFTHLFKHQPWSKLSSKEKKEVLSSSGGYTRSCCVLNHISIFIINHFGRKFTDDENKILKRFAKVFEQTYTRFLDLQKVEAQAKEARIEVALERIRSQSMGMQTANDLSKVTTEMFNQLRQFGGELFATGIVFCKKHKDHVEQWHSIPNAGMMSPFIVPVDLDYIHQYRYNQWKKGTKLFSIEIPSDFIEQHFNDIFNLPSAQKVLKDLKDNNTPMPKAPPWEIDYGASFKYGYILVSSLEHFKEAEILPRFAKVFEQTYTRFLDLQKAEAQAREAQIEASLERIRTQSMLMQHSNELDKTSKVFHEQLRLLGIDSEFSYLWLPDEEKSNHLFWATWYENQKGKTVFKNRAVNYPLDKTEPAIAECYAAWESKEPVHVNPVSPQEVSAYFATWEELLQGADKFKPEFFPDGLYYVDAYMKYGCFGIMIKRKLSEDEKNILSRVTKEFERTYTRFLDLQKAEEQAREAQIEAALEKVRSRSLAMHTTDELQEVVAVVAQKLKDLGVIFDAGGVILCTYFPENKDVMHWIAADDFSYSGNYLVPYFENPIFDDAWDSKIRGDAYFSKEFSVEDKNSFFKHAFEQSDYKHFPDEFKQHALEAEQHRLTAAWSKNSAILIPSFTRAIPSESDAEIIKRFAKVFEQAYIRFMDLQKAEKQAKEAKIEASLEKVRNVALALTKSDDMLDIAQVLYEQLLELGFVDIRNAIIDIHNDATETFLDYDYSHDMSSAVTEFSYYGDPVIEQQIKKTQSGHDAFFEIELKGKQLDELIETRLRNGEQDDPRLHKTDHLTYNLYSFGNGAIGISNFGILTDDQKKILKRFRNVFTFAYKRYTDLANAEAQALEAKIEAALERVRSVALGLNTSEDMLQVAQALYEQLVALDFSNIRNSIIDIDNEDGETFLDYDYSDEMGGTVTQMSYKDDPTLKEQLEDIIATTDGFSEMVSGRTTIAGSHRHAP